MKDTAKQIHASRFPQLGNDTENNICKISILILIQVKHHNHRNHNILETLACVFLFPSTIVSRGNDISIISKPVLQIVMNL